MIENHVPTLETCKNLKEAGFPQETIHGWYYDWREREVKVLPLSLFRDDLNYECFCAAPILTEIMEQLERIGHHLELTHDIDTNLWQCRAKPFNYSLWPSSNDDNPTEAAALLWLELNGGK